MIDAHVHLRDWNQRGEETLTHGFESASMAGFDTVFDMPNTSPAILTEELLLKRVADARSADKSMRYRVYLGLTSDPDQISLACDLSRKYPEHVAGLKMFASQSTGNMGIVTEEEQRLVYSVLRRNAYRGVLAVHCEKESLFCSSPDHSLARPAESEAASVADQIEFSSRANFLGRLHICHISCAESIELVRKAKQQGLRITCGATGHHSLFNSDQRPYLKMNPPLRSEEDRKAVFDALVDGTVDWVESDHAPHSQARIDEGACGIPGFANSLLLFERLRPIVSRHRLFSLFQGNAEVAFDLGEVSTVLFDRMYDNTDLGHLADKIGKRYPLT